MGGGLPLNSHDQNVEAGKEKLSKQESLRFKHMCLLLFQSKISMKHGKNTSLNTYSFGKKRRNNAKLANAQKCSFQSIQVPFDCMLKMNVNTTFFHMPINTITTTTTKACSLQFRLMWMAFCPSVYGEMIVQAVVGRWRLTQQKRGTHFHRLIFFTQMLHGT